MLEHRPAPPLPRRRARRVVRAPPGRRLRADEVTRRFARAAWRVLLAAGAATRLVAAQDAGFDQNLVLDWGEITRQAIYPMTFETTRAHDPHVVRSGVQARWQDTVAVGARAVVVGAADLDGDGGVDRLLRVVERTPATSDPNDCSPPGYALALVRSEPGGFRATVLYRDACHDGEASWRIERRRGRYLVTLRWIIQRGHANDGWSTIEERYRFSLGRDGVLHFVEGCEFWDSGVPDWRVGPPLRLIEHAPGHVIHDARRGSPPPGASGRRCR